MRLLKVSLIAAIIVSLASFAYAQENESCIYFFYGKGCSHCAKVMPVLEEIEERNGNIEMHTFEVYQNRSNLVLIQDYFEKYDIDPRYRGVPAVFIGDAYLIGDTPIINNIDRLIRENQGKGCPTLEEKEATGEVGAKSPTRQLKELPILTVIGAAFVDSINPLRHCCPAHTSGSFDSCRQQEKSD